MTNSQQPTRFGDRLDSAFIVLLLGLCLWTTAALNARADLSQWEEVPIQGGNVQNGIAIDPDDPNHLFTVTRGSGMWVFESLDGAETWHKAVKLQGGKWGTPGNMDFVQIASSETSQTTVYAGKARSFTNGASWEGIPNAPGWISCVDPTTTDSRVLYATRDSASWDTPDPTAFRSADRGDTWTTLGLSLANAKAPEIRVHPQDPNCLLACVVQQQVDSGSEVSGIFKSTNGGATWRKKMSSWGWSSAALCFSPWDPDLWFFVWDGTEDAIHGVYRSANSGESWTHIPPSCSFVQPHPSKPNIVYAFEDPYSGTLRVIRTVLSLDAGKTFAPVGPGPNESWKVLSLAIDDTRETDTLYAGMGPAGISKSVDGGRTWAEKNNGIRKNTIDDIVPDPDDPNTIYVCAERGLLKADLNTTETQVERLPPFSAKQIVFNPFDHDQAALLLSGGNNLLARTTDRGQTWSGYIALMELLPIGPSFGQPNLFASHSTPGRLFLGAMRSYGELEGGLYVSDDFGATFNPTPLFNPPVFDLDDGPTSGGVALYAGVNGRTEGVGGVYRSDDDGQTWTAAGLDGIAIKVLAVDPTNGDRVYAAAAGKKYVYRTLDGGASWQTILPTGAKGNVADIEIDTSTTSHIFVAYPSRILQSTDGGDTWTIFSDGLENVGQIHVIPGAPGPLRPSGAPPVPGALQTPETQTMVGSMNEGLFRYRGDVPPGAPLLTDVRDRKNGWAQLTWEHNLCPPWQFLGFAYDIYTNQWVGGGWEDTLWHIYDSSFDAGNIALTFTGGYHVWMSTQYSDGSWFPCDNPWTGVIYGGIPHTPGALAAADLGSRAVRLSWKPDFFGAWRHEVIAYKIGEGWVETTGSDGTGFWHFVFFPTADFLAGSAEFVVPSPGNYWFFIRSVGWLPPYPAGQFAIVEASVAP